MTVPASRSAASPRGARSPRPAARLVLEDGTVLLGRGFGAAADSIGELVFNTSMSGYQEILTDPSYRGQTVLLTQPHIGNYGVNSEDEESAKLWLSGLVVREACHRASNFRSGAELSDYLAQHGVPGIEGVDTRMLTRRIRDHGEQRVLITRDLTTSVEELLERVRSAPRVADVDHVLAVTTKAPAAWTKAYESEFSPPPPHTFAGGERPRIVAYDFGAKRNILRSLAACGLDVMVVPADTPAEAALEHRPDGIFLSNGPGDPAITKYAIAAARGLVEKLPVFGICLGHQILSHVFGGKTYKMKFGHHGGNQPVIDLLTEKVEITSQNHSYAVDPDSLPDAVEITHKNLNDGTVEGLRHKELPVFSVQYHPEAAPGPHDALYLFERFVELLARR
ncbi:MAG: glutamine-hydrolyzing carbamoyl-phosphate synthase small subunit [Planctomycetes bacterium]|nr:glutamine-hydrolyzing carbamoyl-phosphate synthase small subunit [Planctomycetota bacterium]